VSSFSDDVLIANEVVSTSKCERIAALQRTNAHHGRDRHGGGGSIVSPLRRGRPAFAVGVLVDVNVGQRRCGVAPGDDAVQLARRAGGDGRRDAIAA
jgi:D-serine deaminase-like pyridoxal phosphate-dependent protein